MKIQVKDTYTGKIGTMDDSEMSARYQPVQQTQSQVQQPQTQTAQPQSNIIGNILGGIGRFIAPTTANVVQDIGASLKTPSYIQNTQQNTQGLQQNALDIKNAIASGNMKLAQQLAQQGKNLSGQSQEVPQTSTDINKSYLSRGVGVGGELGPLLYGASGGMKGLSLAKQGALTGATLGLTQPGQDLGERLKSGAIQGIEGGALGKVLGLIPGAGKGAQKAGTGLIQSQYNLPRSAANSLNINDTVKKLSDYGITNINDIGQVAQKITGESGIVSKLTREAVGKAKNVETSGLLEMAKNIVNDPSIPVGQDKKLFDFFKKGVQSLVNAGDTKNGFNANPSDTFGYIQTLEKKAAGLIKGRASYMIPEQDKALANSYQMFADELKDRLFSKAGADSQVVSLANRPEIMSELSKISPKLAQEASQVKTVGELRSLAAPFVRGSQAAQITESGQNLATNTMAGAAKGLGKFIQNPLNLLAMPLSSDTVNSTVGNILNKGGESLGNTQLQGLMPLLTNILVGNKSAPSIVQPTNQGQQNAPSAPYAPNNQINTNNINQNIQQPSIAQSNFTPQKLAAAIVADPKNKEVYEAIFKQLNPNQAPKSAAATQVQGKANAGLNAINRISEIISSDPNIMVKASVPGSPGAREYKAMVSSLTDAIGGLRTGASVSPSQQKFYASMLPQPFDSPQTIIAKLNAVKQELQGYANSNIQDTSLQNLNQ